MGKFKKGPYNIGYRALPDYDYSRNYIERRKPIQIFMWYPTYDSISPSPKLLRFDANK
jgi:hypothetical protein